jgi:O-acetyl-ADP-ribose deacetylase (regulator of RNase III)
MEYTWINPKLSAELKFNVLETTKKLYNKIFPSKDINLSENPREELRKYFITSNIKFNHKIHEYINKILSIENKINAKKLKSDMKLVLYQGDITELEVDVIVIPTNFKGMGCFDACHDCIENLVHSKAGPMLREECFRCMGETTLNPCSFFITSSFNLPSSHILHVRVPLLEENKMYDCYNKILDYCKTLKFKQIAFPLLSSEIDNNNNAFEKNIKICLRAIRKWLKDNNSDTQIIIVAKNKQEYDMFNKIN